MAFGSAYARNLARSAPEPGAMDEMDEMDDDAEAEGTPKDADDPVAMSAFEDFAKAAGIKATPAAYSALKELIHACMKG